MYAWCRRWKNNFISGSLSDTDVECSKIKINFTRVDETYPYLQKTFSVKGSFLILLFTFYILLLDKVDQDRNLLHPDHLQVSLIDSLYHQVYQLMHE